MTLSAYRKNGTRPRQYSFDFRVAGYDLGRIMAAELKRPTPNTKYGPLTCLELFSGAGGLSLGLEKAGFRVVAAVESDRDSARTYAALFPHADLKNCRIEELSFKDYRGIDLVSGGPPCQPFSSGGKRLSRDDSRDMMPEFIRAVSEAQPEAFLMENVPGLLSPRNREYFQHIGAVLSRLGYHLSSRVLAAAEYGVPQKRKRLFLVGVRHGKTFHFPAPTRGPFAGCGYVTAGTCLKVGQLIGTLNKSKVVYAKNPDLRPNPYHGQLFNGGGRPIDLKAPCHTILASAGGNKTHFLDSLNLVPEYHEHLRQGGRPRQGSLPGGRRLTVEESALIQTFPVDRTRFFGSRSSRYSQVGNAVPPLLAEAVGLSVAEAFN